MWTLANKYNQKMIIRKLIEVTYVCVCVYTKFDVNLLFVYSNYNYIVGNNILLEK